MDNNKPATFIIVGAGARGNNYAAYSKYFPEKMRIVGVVDPKERARTRMMKEYNINPKNVFSDYRELPENKLADCVVISSPDADHHEQAIFFAKRGYHILLEKPMATKEEHCREIVRVCEESGVILSVCHVLRYLKPVKTLKKLIMSGVIGKVCHLQHTEPVGFWHFAHSFVRGNWRNEKESSFSLLAKSCHDMDLVYDWMLPNRVTSISSMGSLFHFRPENKPAGASSRCFDCSLEKSCPYSALKMYKLDPPNPPRWPVKIACDVEDLPLEKWQGALDEAMKTGPYGRCVFDCDNDVCDNQVVNMQFDSGATATITMVAYTEAVCCRYTRVFGTLGELSWDASKGDQVKHYDFNSRETKYISEEITADIPPELLGHGGADYYTIGSFLEAILSKDASKVLTGPRASLESHLLVFAAENARITRKVQNIELNSH